MRAVSSTLQSLKSKILERERFQSRQHRVIALSIAARSRESKPSIGRSFVSIIRRETKLGRIDANQRRPNLRPRELAQASRAAARRSNVRRCGGKPSGEQLS